MKVIGLLSWYEEDPDWLVECVTSAARLCDHIIAVDGPYAEYPGALRTPASSTEQTRAIVSAAAGAGIGCTVHASREPWWGNEVAKRAFMFKLGMTVAQEWDDWFLRIDADEILTNVPHDARQLLQYTNFDVGEVQIWERDGSRSPLRCLYRAMPGIAVEQAHYVVTAPRGLGIEVLSGDPSVHDLAEAAAWWDIRLEHRTQSRSELRKKAKREFDRRIPEIEKTREFD